jgi:nucleoside-diphosphate-sugar epimerase
VKTLVVGGAGFIGGDAAICLAAQGHQVTIGGRRPAPAASPMAQFPLLTGDFFEDGFTVDEMRGFDAVIFTAGSDVRHVSPGSTPEAHWVRANAEATPRFFKRVRDAGVPRAVLVGSFYQQAAAHLIDKVPYIAARNTADLEVRALASSTFKVNSVNPPYVIGAVPGVIQEIFAAYLMYGMGKLPFPAFAPGGGSNFISVRSVSEAIIGALNQGENGAAYLIGDENLTYKEYLERYFRAVGNHQPLQVREEEHPLFPDSMLFAGRGGTIAYEPDAAETELLGYKRHDIDRVFEEIIAAYRPLAEAAP